MRSLHGGGGDGVDDVFDGAAAREVVAGAGESLKDGEARRAAQTLGDLVADVAFALDFSFVRVFVRVARRPRFAQECK